MRKSIDCRDYPSDINCTVALSADSENELLDIAAAHVVGRARACRQSGASLDAARDVQYVMSARSGRSGAGPVGPFS